MSFHSSQWKTTTTKSGWTNADPQPSGIEVWAASPGKEPRPTEVLAKGKGTEKGSYKYQLQKKRGGIGVFLTPFVVNIFVCVHISNIFVFFP